MLRPKGREIEGEYMSRVSYWRVYLSAPVDEGKNYVEISDTAADKLRKDLSSGDQTIITIVTGREINLSDSRTLYVLKNHIVALEPIEG